MSDLENLATHTHRSYVHHLREMVNKEKKRKIIQFYYSEYLLFRSQTPALLLPAMEWCDQQQ